MARALGCFHHDDDRLAAAPVLAALRPAGASSFDLSSRGAVPFDPVLGNNDIVGDCTAVALMNAAAFSFRLATGADLDVDEGRCVPFFASVVGCAPTIAAARLVDGAYMIDVLNRQIDHGYDMGCPGMPSIVGTFATVPLRRPTIAAALRDFMALPIEIGVTPTDGETDMPWPELPDRQRTNHAACLSWCSGTADGDTVEIFTWGRRARMSWLALECRMNVAWAPVYPWTEKQ